MEPSQISDTNLTENPSETSATLSPTDSPSSLPSAAETISSSPPWNGTQAENDQEDCDCSNCWAAAAAATNATDTKTLLIVTPLEFEPYLRYHIAEYQQLRPSVNIQLEVVNNGYFSTNDVKQNDDPFRALQKRLLSGEDTNTEPWDGAMFPTHLSGSLQDDLWELDDYFVTSSHSSGVLPFFQRQAMYGNVTKIIPLDGNIARMLYRKDLLQQHNVTVPRTWDEYERVAQYFNQNTNIQGSCVSSCGSHNNADRAFLVLSTMTQNMGTSSGFLFDPITGKPTWGEAMEETLRLFSEHGHEDIQNCQGGGFARGECALTYTWDSGIILSNMGGLEVGVAPTPGSLRVMDQGTGKLENCTPSLCPFGEYYEDVGIVNRAPYAAFGGWASGVSNSTANHRETADFFSYLQSQSFQDILPNDRTDLLDPYQYKHTDAYRWINDGGIAATVAEGFTYSSLAMNSLNAVLNLRVPNSEAFLNIFDEEISSYVTDTRATLEFQESVNLREATATRMTARVENLIAAEPDFLPLYQDSIGFSTAPVEAFNYIKRSYRRVAWGMSGIIITASIILVFWTIVFRKNPVMRAFQPFLLLQCAVGVFFMGVTIILIGLDDEMFDKDILDITCMAGPWAYVVGFTIFFSSVYCKIEECTKILRDPQNNKVLFVSLRADALFTSRLLILNGAILAVWSVADPLRWVRQEVAGGMVFPDGTVETFGMCRGAEFTSFALASILSLTNILMLLIATFRIFKCRLLVLEYNELQWLTLSLIPFLEGWIVGAPVLAISREDPTVIFSTLAFVISVSAACAGTAIFAPKDWYVRKHKYMETRSRKDSDHKSDSGILLLQHPKFENQKQLEHLQMQLEETHALNTELEIEVRGIDERFREIRHMNDHSGPSQSSKAYATPRRSRTSQDVRVAKKAPELEVWKMPDYEDETEVDLSAVDIAGPLESFSKTSNGLPTPSKKNGVKTAGGESELGNLVQSDDVKALGNKADAMAKKFKAGAGRALIGDGIGGVRVLSDGSSRESSPPHANTANGKKQSVGDDETEELVLESTRESVGAYSMFHYNGYQPTRSHMYNSSQKPGEPSGDDSYKKEEENQLNRTVPAISASKATSSNTPATSVPKAHSPQDPAKKVGVSFRTDTQFHVQDSVPNTTYNMGEWSAVGGTGGVLVDMSDASSYNSSANSSTLSTTSMDATMRASALDTPFAKEVDQLVSKKDWDGLQIAAKSYEPGTNTKASVRNSGVSIEAKKRRKRELEASFLRARSKSEDENEAQWV